MKRKNLREFRHFFVVPWKGFKKTLKTFIKHFEVQQRIVKIKIYMTFILVV